jgi:hypothetical protein
MKRSSISLKHPKKKDFSIVGFVFANPHGVDPMTALRYE